MKNFKRRPILIIPLLQEAYSGRKGVGFGSQGAGASTYHGADIDNRIAFKRPGFMSMDLWLFFKHTISCKLIDGLFDMVDVTLIITLFSCVQATL